MFEGFDISPRAALAAPIDPFIVKSQSAAILVASILSLLGGGWMVVSFFVFPELRSLRHHLILGLALSDSIMALNFLLSSTMNVSGRWIGAPEQTRLCSFNGFMTQVFVIQTDYWVFIIAIYTYFVLTDQKRCSNWIQTHPLVPWILPWLLSILWASVGLGVTGYGDIGAWCWFTSDEVRLLVNFVPRWAIIAIMILMYARLYYILFRAHRRLVSLDASESGDPSSGSDSRQLDNSVPGAPALARLMLLYPLAYAVVWSLPTGIRIYQTITGQPAPWQLQTVDKACIVLQGFIDAVIYGATESSLLNWRQLFFPRKFPPFINGVGYGDFSGKRSSMRWSSAPPRSGDQQLVSRASDETTTAHARGTTESMDSLSFPNRTSSSEHIEMGRFDQKAFSSATTIRKTVEIDVVSSPRGRESRTLSLQKPLKAYFPEDRDLQGTFLDV